MSLSLSNMTPDQLAKIVRDGVANNLENDLYAILHEQADKLVRSYARELAQKMAINVQSMYGHDQFMNPQVILNLKFNSEPVETFKGEK